MEVERNGPIADYLFKCVLLFFKEGCFYYKFRLEGKLKGKGEKRLEGELKGKGEKRWYKIRKFLWASIQVLCRNLILQIFIDYSKVPANNIHFI